MTCKFNHLYIGEKILLNVDKGRCRSCGDILVFSGPALYMGHNSEGEVPVDLFNLLEPRHCQKCETEIVQYQEICHKSPPLSESRDLRLSQEELKQMMKNSTSGIAKHLIDEVIKKWRSQ